MAKTTIKEYSSEDPIPNTFQLSQDPFEPQTKPRSPKAPARRVIKERAILSPPPSSTITTEAEDLLQDILDGDSNEAGVHPCSAFCRPVPENAQPNGKQSSSNCASSGNVASPSLFTTSTPTHTPTRLVFPSDHCASSASKPGTTLSPFLSSECSTNTPQPPTTTTPSLLVDTPLFSNPATTSTPTSSPKLTADSPSLFAPAQTGESVSDSTQQGPEKLVPFGVNKSNARCVPALALPGQDKFTPNVAAPLFQSGQLDVDNPSPNKVLFATKSPTERNDKHLFGDKDRPPSGNLFVFGGEGNNKAETANPLFPTTSSATSTLAHTSSQSVTSLFSTTHTSNQLPAQGGTGPVLGSGNDRVEEGDLQDVPFGCSKAQAHSEGSAARPLFEAGGLPLFVGKPNTADTTFPTFTLGTTKTPMLGEVALSTPQPPALVPQPQLGDTVMGTPLLDDNTSVDAMSTDSRDNMKEEVLYSTPPQSLQGGETLLDEDTSPPYTFSTPPQSGRKH
eukprot:TRINITY_DN57139_c0_g1_i1.p1 TRINITY_DN57139_c0_g1~~TRINITY_DN57139_c0_g1_i1.p1  ORF type:complete len:506 (+),score=35.18 TRINITY_DN57139_c0_g1_i1:3-1520(+)